MTDKLTPVRCGCGGEAVANDYIDRYENKTEYFVHCVKCGICSADYDTEAEAVTAWNRAMGGSCKKCNNHTERTAKVIEHDASVTDTDGYKYHRSEYLCGACKKKVIGGDDYCSHCGCRLIWGEDDE